MSRVPAIKGREVKRDAESARYSFVAPALGCSRAGDAVVVKAQEDTEVAKVVVDRGLVVGPENADLLVGAIKILIEHVRKRGQAGQNGRDLVARNLDKEVILDYLLIKLREKSSGVCYRRK